MESLLHDLAFGWRVLRRTPAISLSIILVLAIGIGANSAMFGIVDRFVVHPVDYAQPDRLAFVWSIDSQGVLSNVSPADFMDWRARAKSIAELAGWTPSSFVMTGGERPRQVAGARVTANFFRLLGIKPALGRTFLPDEDGLERAADAAHTAVISYRLWQEELGGDPNVLGRTIRVDSVPYVVVGVAPAGFQFWWRQHDLWIPVTFNIHERDYRDIVAVARLNGTDARTSSEMAVIARSISDNFPASDKDWTVRVEDLQQFLLNRSFRTRLLLLSSSVGLVLLIACANVASLLLGRSAAREREIAVRVSLGATEARLVRQLLTESALLAGLGGGLGLAFAWGLIRVAPRLIPANALPGGTVGWSTPVIWFTAAVSLITCLLVGLAPALATARSGIAAALRQSGRGTTASRARQQLRQFIVVGEIALALMVLTGAWLMMGSFRQLSHISPGFDPSKVLTMRLFLPAAKYDAPRAVRFARAAREGLATLPAVRSAALATTLPLLNKMEVRILEEGAPPLDESQRPSVPYAAVSPDYFRTLGIPLTRGRWFTEADDERAPLVAIVSEALAKRYLGDGNPLGKHIIVDRPTTFRNGGETVKVEVVGVVGNVMLTDLSSDPKPLLYVPYLQNPYTRALWFAARTATDPSTLVSAARAQIAGLDAEQPIEQMGSLEQMLDNQYAQPRFQTELMGSFALIALALACVGIYGINAYSVAQRRNEIGLRMALGASQGAVLREVIGQGMKLIAIGIVVGLVGAEAVAFWLRSVLVGTGRADPVAFVGAALLLSLVAALACYFPARKATRIDPAIALRAD